MNKFLVVAALFFNCMYSNSQTLEKVAEVSTGSGSSSPYNFTAVGNRLFFIATDDAFEIRLFVTEGTAATTQALTPTTVQNGSVQNLVAFNGKLFFSCNDGVHGQELWSSDGTVAGTGLFKDVYAGTGGCYPQYFTVANNKLFFMGSSVDGERRLYASDGTPGGTIIVRNNYIDIFNGFSSFAVLNNDVYFRGDGGPNIPYGLWKSDGTPAGTILVKSGIIPGNMGSNYAVMNNKLYFSCDDTQFGNELWVTDGTATGTHIVKNIGPEAGGVYSGGSPQAMLLFNSKLYFSAGDSAHGQELWVTDGTSTGTALVKDMLPGTEGCNPYQSVVYNGKMYFICAYAQQFWESDGTEAGTQLITTVPAISRFGAVWNNKMFLLSSLDDDFWESNGTAAGTGLAKASNTTNVIDIIRTDRTLTTFNGALYFGAANADVSQSFEPCRLVSGSPVIHSFTFVGNGNWSNPANWAGGIVPPSTLLSGDLVVINGNCILDVAVHAQMGASITVLPGKSLVIVGSLTII